MNEGEDGGSVRELSASGGPRTEEGFYRRRLDRSPDKQEFFQLPEGDRRLICDLRTAMHSVYEKFTKLREQVSDREGEDSADPLSTPDLKKREEFVDMYADPAVNEELRQRLSRSRNLDGRSSQADISARGHVDGFSREKKKRRRSLELEDVELLMKKEDQKRRSLNRGRGFSRTDSLGGGGGGDVGCTAAESDDEIATRKTYNEDKMSQSAQTLPTPSSNFPNQGNSGYFHPFYMYPPVSTLPQAPFPTPLAPPPGYLTPYQFGVVAQMPFVYPAAPSFQPAGVHHDQEVPVKDTAGDVKQTEQQMEPPTKGSSSADAAHDLLISFAQRPATGTTKVCARCSVTDGIDNVRGSTVGDERCPICAEAYFAENEFTALRGPVGSPHSFDLVTPRKNAVGRKTSRNFTNAYAGAETVGTRQSVTGRTSRLMHSSRVVDRPLRGSISQKLDQQISMLIEELEKSKDQNIRLRDELMAAEKELDSLRFICQNKDAEIRSQATGKLAIMVQEIYRAQKERDVAMMNRINRANAERDEAFLRLKRLQQKYSEASIKKESSTEEMKLNEVLTRLQSDTRPGGIGGIEQRGAEIVEAITRMKEQRWQIAAEEMRAILEERDLAVAKCKDLELELSQMRSKVRDEESVREQRQVLQGKLFAMEHERNQALEQITKLEDEVLSLRIYYNLHGSLSQEVSLYHQFSKTLDGVEKEMRTKEEEVEALRTEKDQLLEQAKITAAEKKQMIEEIDRLQESQRTESSKSERLQRLVTVLRRKINGLGIKFDDPE